MNTCRGIPGLSIPLESTLLMSLPADSSARSFLAGGPAMCRASDSLATYIAVTGFRESCCNAQGPAIKGGDDELQLQRFGR